MTTGTARYDEVWGWETTGLPLYEGRVVFETDGQDDEPDVEERHISVWRLDDGRFVELYRLYSRADGDVYEEVEGVEFDSLEAALDDARRSVAEAEEDIADILSWRQREAASALWAEWLARAGGVAGTA